MGWNLDIELQCIGLGNRLAAVIGAVILPASVYIYIPLSISIIEIAEKDRKKHPNQASIQSNT